MERSLPPLRALVRGAAWCGVIWAVGYGSYVMTIGQMEKNLKKWENDIDDVEKIRVKTQHEQFLEGVLGKEKYAELRARAEAEKKGR